MDEILSELFASARDSLRKGDTDTALGFLDRILEQDLTHAGAWKLLHQEIGGDSSLQEFQIDYVGSYYPEKLHLFTSPAAETVAETPEERELEQPEPSKRKKPKDSLRRITIPRDRKKEKSDRPRKPLFPRPKTGPVPNPRRIKTEPRADSAKETEEKTGPDFLSRLAGRTPDFLKRFMRRFGLGPGLLQWPNLRVFRRSGKKEPAEKQTFVRVTPPKVSEPPPTLETSLLSSAKKIEKKSKDTQEDGDNGSISLQGVGKIGTIKVLVVDDMAQTRQSLQKLLLLEPNVDVVGLARTGKQAVQLAVQKEPDVVLMDINMPDMDGLEATRQIKEKLPLAQVIMLTVQDDPVYMREALRSGARDFLIKPPGIDDLFAAIHQAEHYRQVERGRQEKLFPELYSDDEIAIGRQSPGPIISVFSPKGGVGCTTLAANLAVALHSEDTPAVLMDGQLKYGNTALFFNEQGRTSVLDLATRLDDLEPDFVREVAIPHAVSGVSIIPAPARPPEPNQVNGDQLVGLLTYLQPMYGYVVVDLGSNLDNWTLPILESSDLVFLVITQDIPAINDARRFLELAPKIGIRPERVTLVLNQYHKRINVEPDRISAILKKEISCVVPLDSRIVIPSVNRGMPFMTNTAAKSSPIGLSLLEMAGLVRDKIVQIGP